MYDYKEIRNKEKSMSKILSYLRTQSGLTQSRVAREINLDAATVSSHENARSIPDVYTLIKYCILYKISLAHFFHMVEHLADNSMPVVISSDITRAATVLHLTK